MGSCIYCGCAAGSTKEKRLCDEHIIPYALGGTTVLPKSSCHKCGAATGRIEQRVLRGGFRGIKERLALSSRTKDRPKRLPLFNVNGGTEKVDVAIEHYPAIIILPRLFGPTLGDFTNKPAVEDNPWLYVPQPDYDTLNDEYKISSFASPSIDTHSFALMLAKIGHAFATAEKGLGTFVPFLPPIIASDPKFLFLNFVGSLDGIFGEPNPQITHGLRLGTEEAGGRRYLTCHICLFANFAAPAYRVVVGQLLEDFNPLLSTPSPIPGDPRSGAPWRLAVSFSKNGAQSEPMDDA